MTTQEVADRYVELADQGKNVEIQMELYADDVECIEPAHSQNPGAKGKAVVLERLKNWYAGLEEMHSSSRTPVVVAGNHFSFGAKMDMTFKGAGRMQMEEVCVYEVKDGKIVKEQYFY